jgi:uncharacterized protein (TIGR01619 family)
MSDVTGNAASADDDHWEIYVTYVDEKPAVILVDIGVSAAAPLPDLPTLCWLWVHLKNPDEQGFPSDDENDALNDLEDVLTDSLNQAETRYVGRVTTDGRREFYFYTSGFEKFRELAETTMKTQPEYRFEVDQADDAEWQHYREVLFPAPEDLQQIRNQHIINQLEMAGDSLEQPRPVDHYANFKTNEDRERFIAAAQALNFEAVSRPDREPEFEFPFAVGLLRVDSVDPETVDKFTFELWELAGQHNGEYEGWGSGVVKSKR